MVTIPTFERPYLIVFSALFRGTAHTASYDFSEIHPVFDFYDDRKRSKNCSLIFADAICFLLSVLFLLVIILCSNETDIKRCSFKQASDTVVEFRYVPQDDFSEQRSAFEPSPHVPCSPVSNTILVPNSDCASFRGSNDINKPQFRFARQFAMQLAAAQNNLSRDLSKDRTYYFFECNHTSCAAYKPSYSSNLLGRDEDTDITCVFYCYNKNDGHTIELFYDGSCHCDANNNINCSFCNSNK